ncbi:MAG: hypothetical protein QXY67_00645 [Zestosphaera sp.]
MPKILLLRSKELEELLSPEVLIPEIENAFIKYSRNETVTPPRTVMWVEGKRSHRYEKLVKCVEESTRES